MKQNPLVKEMEEAFLSHRDPEIAGGMENYLRNQFACLGIKSPLRRELLKKIIPGFRKLEAGEWPDVAERIWDMPSREYQYAAMELVGKRKKELGPEHLPLLEKMITDKSWWDTVDFIASNLVGELFRRHPELIEKTIRRWMKTGNFWLHRTCILFQLKFGKKTDHELLFMLCRHYAGEKEFFIRKAIGWALRQYSKYNAQEVRKFIGSQQLSPLSLKEASKYV